METMIKEKALIKKGRMKKALWTMTEQEKEVWRKQMEINIRTYLFSIGQPLVYEKNGQMIAEFSDGTIEKI